MGKGDGRRPRSVTKETYDKNYEAAFGCENGNDWNSKEGPGGDYEGEDPGRSKDGVRPGSEEHKGGST